MAYLRVGKTVLIILRGDAGEPALLIQSLENPSSHEWVEFRENPELNALWSVTSGWNMDEVADLLTPCMAHEGAYVS